MSENITIHSIVVPVENVSWSCIDNEAILLNLENGFYYTLNEVGCDSWKLIDARRMLKDIGAELCKVYDVDRQQVERDLLTLAEELRREKLITVGKHSTFAVAVSYRNDEA